MSVKNVEMSNDLELKSEEDDSSAHVNSAPNSNFTSHSFTPKTDEKKVSHSEIEKRRRQKMNRSLNELVNYLPINNSSKNKKIDKISILKNAVQQIKNLKSCSTIPNTSFSLQNYMTQNEINSLFLKDCEDFFIVLKCDSGRVLYVSESCQNFLGSSMNEIVGKVFFEFIHPADTKQVKDQLTYTDKQTDWPIPTTLSHMPGDRRSFYCRVRLNGNKATSSKTRKSPIDSSLNKPDYQTIHFTGYLRYDFLDQNKAQAVSVPSSQSLSEKHNQKQCYLVANGQAQPKTNQLVNFEFVSRHDSDGKFIYVEPSVNLLLGCLPHQLFSDSLFNHVHKDDVSSIKKSFREAIDSPKSLTIKTEPYRLRLDNRDLVNSYTRMQSSFWALVNPSNDQLEYVVAHHRLYNRPTLSNSSIINSINNNSSTMPMTPSPEENSYGCSELTTNSCSESSQQTFSKLKNISASNISLNSSFMSTGPNSSASNQLAIRNNLSFTFYSSNSNSCQNSRPTTNNNKYEVSTSSTPAASFDDLMDLSISNTYNQRPVRQSNQQQLQQQQQQQPYTESMNQLKNQESFRNSNHNQNHEAYLAQNQNYMEITDSLQQQQQQQQRQQQPQQQLGMNETPSLSLYSSSSEPMINFQMTQ